MQLASKVIIFAFCALIPLNGFAVEPKKMTTTFKAMLDGIREEALKNDSLYMEEHKEEAINEALMHPSDKIPARTPDKFVRILFYPYTNQDGVYKGFSVDIFKYKDGRFVFANDIGDVEGENIKGINNLDWIAK